MIDPTLLLEANDYSKLIDTLPPTLKSKTRPKLFAYFLDYAEDLKNVSQQISSKYFDNSYDVFYIRKTQHNSIEEWLKGFRDSKFVITDSFHGVVFSVLNNRDFVVIINETQSVGRIHSLLAALGISEDRIFYRNKKMDINIEKLPLIDWESVNRKLCELRIESGDWLLNMIKRKR